ncbi:hypothetical protein ACW95P_00480 [Candidatus Mycoplasma pogonae]
MISAKSFEEVTQNLKKYKLKKTKLGKVNFNDIYHIDGSFYDDGFDMNKLTFDQITDIFCYEPDREEICLDTNHELDFQNKNDKYIDDPSIMFFREYKTLKAVDKDYDLYILKNEYFGYDSSKLDFLINKRRQPFLKYPLFYFPKREFKKQTLILVKNKPVDGKAEFFFRISDYCEVIYGYNVKTSLFQDAVGEFIKEIFGWPIINYWLKDTVDSIHNYYNEIDFETQLNEVLTKNNFKEITVMDILKNYIIVSLMKNVRFKENWFLNNSHKNKIIEKEISDKFGNFYDLLKSITTIDFKIFNTLNPNFNNYEKYHFWEDKEFNYLKFFKVSEDFIDVKELPKKNQKIQENYKKELDEEKSKLSTTETLNTIQDVFPSFLKTGFNIHQIIGNNPNFQEWAFNDNVIITSSIKWPILIWDQRNFVKPFYKFVIPFNVNNFYDAENSKIFFEKLLVAIKKFNNLFIKLN